MHIAARDAVAYPLGLASHRPKVSITDDAKLVVYHTPADIPFRATRRTDAPANPLGRACELIL
jgi:hypothetical protein